MADLVNRIFEQELAYGSTLHVPSVSNLSTQTKNTSSNAATVFETITESNTDLTVGTWEYSAIAVETFTKQQVPRDLIATYAPKQGYTLAASIDTNLTGLVSSVTNSVGTMTNELQYEDVLRALQYLDDANVPIEDRSIGVSPAQRAGFMKLDQFVNRDYAKLNDGTQSVAAARANLGNWLGIPSYMSSNIEGTNAAGHNNFFMQKEQFALVLQLDATTHTFFDLNYLAFKVVVENIYGYAQMRTDHCVNMQGA